MRRMPSIVSTARRLPLVVAGGERERQRVEDQGLAGRGRARRTPARVIRCATSSLRSAVLAIPTSSIVSAIRAAPCAFAIGATTSSLSRPASRLTELTIARPGICSSAVLDHVGLGRVDLDRRGLGERHALDHLAHLLVLVLALGQRHADVEHVRAARHLVLGDGDQAVVVVGQQQLLRLARALRVDPLADQRRAAAPARAASAVIIDATSGAAGCGRARRPRAIDPLGERARCARASCRSSRRRCRRRSARRTRRARRPAARAPRGRSSRPRGPGGDARVRDAVHRHGECSPR